MKIKKLELHNVKCFKDKTMDFTDNNGQALSTVILVGDNGAGKSTILKSIVHILTVYNKEYGGERFDNSDLRNDEKELIISLNIDLNNDEKFQLIDKEISKESEESLKHLQVSHSLIDGKWSDMRYYFSPVTTDEFFDFWGKLGSNDFKGGDILYFDSFRFLPKIKIEGPNNTSMPLNLKQNSLASSVINNGIMNGKYSYIKQWLVNLDFKRLKNPSPENELLFSHVINSFNILYKPYKFSGITDSGDILFELGGNKIEMNKLSDGFKNVFIIIGEIFYRLCSAYPEDIRFFEREAVILIDEIDCHLHPKWQINFVPFLRKMFPNCQIIATTHSPLITEGIQENYIFKLGDEVYD